MVYTRPEYTTPPTQPSTQEVADRSGTSTLKRVFYEISEIICVCVCVCANVPSILLIALT